MDSTPPDPALVSAPDSAPPRKSRRIDSVDALRGFALLGIMLFHNVEQFNFYHEPDRHLALFRVADPYVWQALSFLFSDKSYAIFSMLFGFSFWVQYERMKERLHYDIGARYIWRLFLLLGFGLVHSIYYSGDLLIFYALFGLIPVAMRKTGDCTVLVTSIILLLLPYNVVRVFLSAFTDANLPGMTANWQYWGQLFSAQNGGTLLQLLHADVVSGLPANVIWTWEAGRMFHIPGLFLLGMLAGRRKAFTQWTVRRWVMLGACALSLNRACLFCLSHLESWGSSESLCDELGRLLGPYSSLTFMIVLVTVFILLWRAKIGERLFRVLIPYGRMSLTNYMSQALLCVPIYYQFGLGMHHYFGAIWSLITGACVMTVQIAFSHWWLARHRQGPLEMLWRRLMWHGSAIRP